MEFEGLLPPILVDRRTLRVIDGMHRLVAAFLKGHETIHVEFFDGTAEEAFLRAVEANVTHGLPLSRSDRVAAAGRIIASHSQMSDRAIARASGLGARAVAAIRRRSGDGTPELNARVGLDGKVRPLNSVEGRRRAAELIAENPDASLREIARLAGISPATVSDVRKRLQVGELPVPEKPGEVSTGDQVSCTVVPVQRRSAPAARLPETDPASLVDRLLLDPSLRYKEEGRQLLRLLQRNAIGDDGWAKLADVVPSHCGDLVVTLARQYAETWLGFARELDERARVMSQGAASG
ncbi:winged helix-turn-helix transcriptional regulator [Streptomyces sp. NPDC002138]|uniref:ParB and winged helix-turn-helix domain-containing protein n=1 Tax=Streptomyces sp. NPDC002138 TaxID=3154410 RepID=UPI00331C2B45